MLYRQLIYLSRFAYWSTKLHETGSLPSWSPHTQNLILEFCSTFFLQLTILYWTQTISFRIEGTTHYISIPDFGAALELYSEFIGTPKCPTLSKHVNQPTHSVGLTLSKLIRNITRFNRSQHAYPLTIQYILAILAHTLTGRKESTGVVNTSDAYFLWSM